MAVVMIVAVRTMIGTKVTRDVATVRVTRRSLTVMVDVPETQQEQHAQNADQE